MKKTIFVFSILAIALLALGITSPALAAERQRGGPGNGDSNGNQGELGTGMGVPIEQNIALDGLLEDMIHENLATALGVSPLELAARLDAGETIYQIGLSLGFDLTTISEVLTQARIDALAQAVATGLITQEQADWLASHGNKSPASSYCDGVCDGDFTADETFQSMQKHNWRKGSGR